jgi:hypothetical protein
MINTLFLIVFIAVPAALIVRHLLRGSQQGAKDPALEVVKQEVVQLKEVQKQQEVAVAAKEKSYEEIKAEFYKRNGVTPRNKPK